MLICDKYYFLMKSDDSANLLCIKQLKASFTMKASAQCKANHFLDGQ